MMATLTLPRHGRHIVVSNSVGESASRLVTALSSSNSIALLYMMTKLNTILTAIGAIVATVTAIFTGLNTLKLDLLKSKVAELDVVVKELDVRDRTQKVSSDFADIFLKQVMPHSKVVNDEKNIQALLSILDIVAQASADDKGWSEAEARKLMPLNLALILGESGCVAALDPHYKYLTQWVGTAMSDNHPRTLATAVKALHGIGLRALREEKLPVVEECISSIEQLIKNIPPSPNPDEASPFLVAAISARAQLRQSLVESGANPKENREFLGRLPPRRRPAHPAIRGELPTNRHFDCP